jgi:uncharacterized SAM-binding protein YcdF (DUF218 family)
LRRCREASFNIPEEPESSPIEPVYEMADDANPSALKTSSWTRPWLLLLLTFIAALLLFFAVTGAHIASAASGSPSQRADVIVVFGAAEYAGRPSPVFRARLDHGYELYKQGMAPMVITTGGSARDPEFSEGGVGKDYLLRLGIPEQALIAETQGSDTAQSASRVANIMHTNGMHSCIAVSDAYHVFRIRALLQHEGVQVELAPRPDSRPRESFERFAAVMREAASYLAWKFGV